MTECLFVGKLTLSSWQVKIHSPRHQGRSIRYLFAFEVHVSLLAVWFGAIVWQPSLECPTHPSSVVCIPGVRPIT